MAEYAISMPYSIWNTWGRGKTSLFPCLPSLPTLALDLEMLDFVRELFVNAAPNITTWCETLEGFLSTQKFKLATWVSLLYYIMENCCNLVIEYFAYPIRKCHALVCNTSGHLKPENA